MWGMLTPPTPMNHPPPAVYGKSTSRRLATRTAVPGMGSLLSHHTASGHCAWDTPSGSVPALRFPQWLQRAREESKQVPVEGVGYPVLTGAATMLDDTVTVQNTLPGWRLGLSPLGGGKREFYKDGCKLSGTERGCDVPALL